MPRRVVAGDPDQGAGGPVLVRGRGGGGREGARGRGSGLSHSGLSDGWAAAARARRSRTSWGVRRFQGWVPGKCSMPRSRQIEAMMSAMGSWSRSSSRSGSSRRSRSSACSASASAPSVRRWMVSSTARMICLRAARRRSRRALGWARAGQGRRACGRGRWCGAGCGRCGRRRWWGRARVPRRAGWLLGCWGGLAVEGAGEVGADLDQLVEDLAVVLGVLVTLGSVAGRLGRGGRGGHRGG